MRAHDLSKHKGLLLLLAASISGSDQIVCHKCFKRPMMQIYFKRFPEAITLYYTS